MAISKKPKYPRICPQGKTYTDSMAFQDKNHNYIDYSSYNARIEIRSSLPVLGVSTAGDDDVLFTLTTDNGLITIDGIRVRMTIPASVTATFPVGNYFWELELFTSDATPVVPYIMEPSAFKVRQENTLNE